MSSSSLSVNSIYLSESRGCSDLCLVLWDPCHLLNVASWCSQSPTSPTTFPFSCSAKFSQKIPNHVMPCFHPKQIWFSQSWEAKEVLCKNMSLPLGKPMPVGAHHLSMALTLRRVCWAWQEHHCPSANAGPVTLTHCGVTTFPPNDAMIVDVLGHP